MVSMCLSAESVIQQMKEVHHIEELNDIAIDPNTSIYILKYLEGVT